MNNEIHKYLNRHMTVVATLIVMMFAVLTIGEIILYRNEMKLNMMISEGLIQLKEEKKQSTTPSPTITMMIGKSEKTK